MNIKIFFGTVILPAVLSIGMASAQTPKLTTLYAFDGKAGSKPHAGLVQGPNGNFYGVAYQASEGDGAIFEITPAGAMSNLFNFNQLDGATPQSPLILGKDGNFYGEAAGGTNGNGTLFKISPGGTFTSLYSFTAPAGVSPSGPLLQGADGSFYGVTQQSATTNFYGTVYRFTTNGVITNLYSFAASGTNGDRPLGGLAQGPDGVLYGTTAQGGTNGNYGTIFKITTNGAFQSLWSFNGTNGNSPQSAPLVFGPDGNLYGTTYSGGTNGNYGTIFQITPGGTFKSLASLNGTSMGAYLYAGLTPGTNGTFYGATYGGDGTIFQITTSGTFTTLYSFDGTAGYSPQGTLIQATDGNLYGTTVNGGTTTNLGTVFKLTIATPAAAAPVFTVVKASGGTLNFSWSSIVGRNYQVQYKTNLPGGTWSNLNSTVTATSTTTAGTDTLALNNHRFYRVVLLP